MAKDFGSMTKEEKKEAIDEMVVAIMGVPQRALAQAFVAHMVINCSILNKIPDKKERESLNSLMALSMSDFPMPVINMLYEAVGLKV